MLVKVLFSIIFWLFLIILSIIILLISFPFFLLNKDSDILHKLSYYWGKLLLSISFTKLRIKRYSNKIDKSKEYIFMCNHQSFFDTYILFTLLRDFKAVFLLKKELYKIPLMGIVFKKLNYIPIERGKRESSYKSLINAINSIKNGQSVIIYPEGTRSEDGRLLPLKKGGFIIAARSKRDIVPIKIKYRKKIIQSKGSFLINPFQVVDAYIYDPIKSDRADVNELLKKIESLLT